MKYRLTISHIILALLTVYNSHGQKYGIRHFNPENGLDGTYVYTTTEDLKGFKWIGTDHGLIRFDGVNFKTYDRNDSTNLNFATTSHAMANGNVIFGYYNGYIKLFNGIELKVLFTPDKEFSAIRSLCMDKYMNIWALSQNDGIIRISGNTVDTLSVPQLEYKKSNVIIHLDDVILVGTNEGTFIFRTDGKRDLQYIGDVPELRNLSIQDIVKRRQSDTYWVATDNDGIFQMIVADTRKDRVNIKAYQTDFLQDISAVSIREAENKDLWIATKYTGIIKVNFNRDNTKPRQFTYMNQDTGFPGDQTSTIHIDKDGNLWVGTIGDGLIQVFREGIIFYNFERFRARSVNSISGTTNHEFLFGTDVGLIKGKYLGNADSLNFTLIDHDSIVNQNITAIYVDPNDKVYFAVRNKGLYTADQDFKVVKKIDFKHRTKRIKIRQVVRDRSNNLWISVMHNGIFVIDTLGNIKDHYATKTGFFHNEIYNILIDSKDNKWFASHSAGLAVMKPDGKIQYLSTKGIFPARDVNDISEDESGNIWIGTYGNGIYEYDGENFIRFAVNDGLLNNYCNAIMSDRNNHIWVSHRVGLSRIDEYTNAISTIQEKDGLTVTEFILNSIYRDQDHNIWLGNRNGVTFLNTPDEMFEPKMLETIITDVKIDHKEKDLYQFSKDKEVIGKIPSQMTFPYDLNNLTFEYIAINLKNPQANLYEFKLNGYDKEWSPPSKENSITYTNLNPGDYSFLIRQSDNPNHWSDNITQLQFTITPPWWNTWLAKIFFGLAGLALVYMIIQIRTYRLNKRLEEKKEFIRITENQNKRLKNYSFITSHNIRASVGNLMGLIEIVEKEPDNKEYVNMLRITAQKLDITVQHISDLLNFENKIAELKRVDCDVLETIQRVITLNSKLIRSKGAKIEIDIPHNTKIKAIPAYLDSVCNNLITNAVRYGTTDSSKDIQISVSNIDHKTTICIEDHGMGIDMKKYKSKLFKLGSRFHSAKSDGHGLGLFMSKHQLEAMGGTIEMESKVNKGTTIKLQFEQVEDMNGQ